MASPYFQGTLMSRGSGAAGVQLAEPGIMEGGTGAGIADALAKLVTVATYDPERDPNAQKARLYGEQARALANTREGQLKLSGLIATLTGPADVKTKASAVSSTVAQSGLDPEAVGKILRLAGAMAGYDQASMDQFFQASGGRPDQTRGAYDAGLASHERASATSARIAAAASRYHTDRAVGEQRHQFDNAGVNVLDGQGNPVYLPRSQAVGKSPVLSDSEAKGTLLRQEFPNMPVVNKYTAIGATPNDGQIKGALLSNMIGDMTRPEKIKAVGAEPTVRPARNYRGTNEDGSLVEGRTVDDRTDMTTGAVIPQNAKVYANNASTEPTNPTTGVKTDVQRSMLGLEDFISTIDKMQALVSDPQTKFGITGQAADVVHRVMGQVDELRAVFGDKTDAVIAQAREDFKKAGLSEFLGDFSDNRARLDVLHNIAAYKGAMAMAGQQGHGLNKDEYQNFQRMLGDPTSFGADRAEATAKLGQVREQAVAQYEQMRKIMDTGKITPASASIAQPPMRGPAAPPAPLQTQPNASPDAAKMIEAARRAIQNGTDAEVVKEYLRRNNVDPGGL